MRFVPKISSKAGSSRSFFLWIFALLGWGAFLVVFVMMHRDSLFEKAAVPSIISKDQKVLEYDGAYWLRSEGRPVELKVLTDESCGNSCDVSREIQGLKANVSDLLYVNKIDVNTAVGKALIDKFDLWALPQFIVGDGVESLNMPNGAKFLEAAEQVYVAKGGDYLLRSEKIGLSPKIFLRAPEFGHLDSEPGLRGGDDAKLTVVEFTDFQCPFCQRLSSQIKNSVEKLVEEGKINYVIKDFPLNFHPNARFAHLAASRVYNEKGSQAYFDFVEKIFAEQKTWGNLSADQVTVYFADLAQGYEVVIAETDWNDGALNQELYGDLDEGRKYGVSGTPALFIGKQFISGAIGAAQFEKAVEEALSEL